MILQVTIVLLCGAGLYASAFMVRKARRAARGDLLEPSVVQTPRARLGGIPNAAIGLAYYAALIAATPFLGHAPVRALAFASTLGAAAFSLYLAYSLLFVTRMRCVYCWTSHLVNWTLACLVPLVRPPGI